MDLTEQYKETNLFTGCSFKLKVFEVIHKQRSIMKLHWHDYLEILYFVEGTPTINIGTMTFQAGPGDILFVNSRYMHAGYSPDGSLVKYYAIVIDRAVLEGDASDPGYRKYIQPFLNGTCLFPTRLDRNQSYYRKIKGSVKALILENRKELPGYELKSRSILYSIFIDIFRGIAPIGTPDSVKEKDRLDSRLINDLISHIYLTCPDRMTLADAAQFVKLSPFYFCKVFKKATGVTFVDFMNSYRISKAEDFLLYTEDTISNIASDLGFCNTNYFDKVFKQVKGVSPSEFRKNAGLLRKSPEDKKGPQAYTGPAIL